MRLVASDGYFGCDLFCGFGFGWVRILVWCSNGGFGGLVWCFNSVSEVMVVVVLLLFGWFGVSWWLVQWC